MCFIYQRIAFCCFMLWCVILLKRSSFLYSIVKEQFMQQVLLLLNNESIINLRLSDYRAFTPTHLPSYAI